MEFVTSPDGTFGLQAVSGNLYVFGSEAAPVMPVGLNYQQLVHPNGVAMTRLLYTENFNGKIYAIAEYADGAVYHFYDGARVTSWDSIYTTVADKTGVAAGLTALIDLEAPFNATALGDTAFITAATPGVPYSISKSTTNGGTDNTQDITLTLVSPNVVAVPEQLAFGTFDITAGTAGGGNQITSVTVNGVTVTSGAMAWATSNAATAAAVAANITTFASSPKYTATSNGNTVRIIPAAGTGSGPNGFAIVPTAGGTVTVGNINNMAFGSNAIAAQAQVYSAQIIGTFEPGDTFTIGLSVASLPYSNFFTVAGSASGTGKTAKTFKTKIYSTTRSLLYFCEINDPTKWGTNINGSGFINISNEDAGSEDLCAMGVYQGKLAVFSRRSVQIWDMDPDPTQNVQTQILNNIGTYAPKSVVNFGDLDVFFLSDSGVRSLRARDASNAATVSDIGTNIDTLIAADLVNVSEVTKAAAVGIIEPIDGRYWLAIADKIYVFSYFPTPGVSAWSTYETGFSVSDFAYASGRIYARSGNKVYVYGGLDGTVYDSSEVDVILPYMDGGKPASTKTLQAIDMACDGIWSVKIGMDLSNEEARDQEVIVNGSTFMNGRQGASGIGTHIGVQLLNSSPGYARIGNFVAHFEINDAG